MPEIVINTVPKSEKFGGRYAFELIGRQSEADRDARKIHLVVDQRLKGFKGLPFSYRIVEDIGREARLLRRFPTVQIMAAPGASIVLENFPNEFTPLEAPLVEILRVQDPSLIPPVGSDFNMAEFTRGYTLNVPPQVIDLDWSAPGEGARPKPRLADFGPDCFIVSRTATATTIRHPYTAKEVTIDVDELTTRPQELSDASMRYAFEFTELPGLPHTVLGPKWLGVRILATEKVKVSIADSTFVNSLAASIRGREYAADRLLSPFELYRAENVNSFPLPGKTIDPQKYRVGPINRGEVIAETAAEAFIDVGLGMIPVVGDVIDVVEFTTALWSRKDKWGNHLSSLEMTLMGVGALLPFVNARTLRSVRKVLSK